MAKRPTQPGRPKAAQRHLPAKHRPAVTGVVSRIRHRVRETAPLAAPGRPWWTALPVTFAAGDERFRLGLRDRARVETTAAIDVALRTSAATLVGLTAVPLGYHPAAFREMLESRSFYQKFAESGDPDAFFERPARRAQVRHDPAFMPLFRPEDGSCEDLTFLSPYEPANERLHVAYTRHKANLVAHARYWRHNDGPRPTILMIHGFGADAFWLNEWMFELRWFYEKLGCDVALFTLPFHGVRQTRNSPFSGHGFFAGGLSRINEAFGQAVCDVRVFLDYLRRQYGAEKIGVTGISLGGYTTALLAGVESSLAFAIPNVPVVSIADLVLEWEPVGTFVRAAMAALNLTIVDMRSMLAVTSPLTYAPRIDRERLMIVGGVADRLAPPKHSRLLWDHWQQCRMHWFPGSHVLHLDKGEYLRQIAKFLAEIEFIAKR